MRFGVGASAFTRKSGGGLLVQAKRGAQVRQSVRPVGLLAQLGAEALRAQDRLVEVELAVQLLHDRRLNVEIDDRVDAFGLLVDLERQSAPAPHVDLLHGAAAGADDVEVRVERGSDGPLLEVGIEDDHELVVTQQTHLLLWTMRLRTHRSRRVFASANVETLPDQARGPNQSTVTAGPERACRAWRAAGCARSSRTSSEATP